MLHLPKSLRRFEDKIESIEDLRSSDEGFWVHLKTGWINTMDSTHSVHEDTITDCVREMRFVEQCNGDCCQTTGV